MACYLDILMSTQQAPQQPGCLGRAPCAPGRWEPAAAGGDARDGGARAVGARAGLRLRRGLPGGPRQRHAARQPAAAGAAASAHAFSRHQHVIVQGGCAGVRGAHLPPDQGRV